MATSISGNVYKVRLLLAQLGIAYRRVDTTQSRGEPQSPKFRALNPIGKIPTVVLDDGRMLSEFRRDPVLLRADFAVLAEGRLGAGAGAALDVFRAIQPRAVYRGEPALEKASTGRGAGTFGGSHRRTTTSEVWRRWR